MKINHPDGRVIMVSCRGCWCHEMPIQFGDLYHGCCSECGCPKTTEAFDWMYAAQEKAKGAEVQLPRPARPVSTKRYLGDGVYVDYNAAGQLVLTTENGVSVTNEIYLEPEVYGALTEYVRVLKDLAT